MNALATNLTSLTGQAALRYAKRGWPVFPIFNPTFRANKVVCSCPEGDKCDRIGKHPNFRLVDHGLHGATCDMAAVERWWTQDPCSSIGIRMGRRSMEEGIYEGCGYVLLDIDNGYSDKGHLRQGDYEMDILEDCIGKLPDTWETRSGTGRHLWFRHPGGDLVLTNKGNLQVPKPETWGDEVAFLDKTKRKLILKSLQIRGDGGYVVAPPSRHYSRNAYTWTISPKDIPEAADIPEGLLRVIGRRHSEKPTDDYTPDGSWPDMAMRIKRAKAYLDKMDPAVSGQGGHDVTFRVATRLVRGFVLSVREAYELMSSHYNPRCVPPWDEEDLIRKCEEAATRSHLEWGFAYHGDAAREMEREMARIQRSGAPSWVENDRQADMVSASAALRLVEEEDGPTDPPGPPNPPMGGGQDDEGGGGLNYHFITGSEAELAVAMRSHLETNGRILTYSESFFWLYDPRRGVWSKLNDLWIEGQMRRFEQCPLGDNKLMKISSSMCKGATKILANTYALQGGDLRLASGIEAYHFSREFGGIAFRNGFLRISVSKDLREIDIELVPHSPRNMARLFLDMNWTDESQPSPLLDSFLDNLFFDVADREEKTARISVIQEFVGAALAGICTTLQGYLLLKGDGNNGKSELIRLIESLFDEESIASIPVDAFDKNFRLRALVGARINIADDLASGKLSASATAHLRRLITGNRIDLDVKYRDPTSFVPIAGHIYSANDLFEPHDSTEGQWRRCIVLPMTANFGTRPDLRRPNASREVITHERPQLVQWAIRGLIRLIREQNGTYTTTQGSLEAKQEWRESSDPVYEFLCNLKGETREKLNSKEGYDAQKLYEDYCQSLQEIPASIRGRFEMTLTAFGKKTGSSDLIEKKRKTKGLVCWATKKLVELWDRKDMMARNDTESYEETVKKMPEGPLHMSDLAPGKRDKP